MKIINFSFGTKKFRYKFPLDEPRELIDVTIRKYFHIPANTNYLLVDLSDATIVSLFSLAYLDNEANVQIEIINSNTSNPTSSSHMVNNCDREVSSFSDNSKKLKSSDLSSTSQSESDSNSIMHYNSMVSHTGEMKLTDVQIKRKNREIKIIFNRRINYFIHKYAHVDPIDTPRIASDIMKNLNIQINELYNTLKFIRNKMNISSLNLNKENIVNVIGDIYKNNYLNDNGIIITECR